MKFKGLIFQYVGLFFLFSSVLQAVWLPPVNLSTVVIDEGANSPQVAIQGNSGYAISVWSGVNNPDGIIQEAHLLAGSFTWSSITDLSASGQSAQFPQIALDVHGNAVAVWQRFDGANVVIQASTLAAGGNAWSSPVDLSLPGQNAERAQVAIDAQGNAVAIWVRGGNTIEAATLESGGGWSAPVVLTTGGLVSATAPQVVMDPSGNAVAAWRQNNGSLASIQYVTLLAGGSFSSPVLLSDPIRAAGSVDIGADAKGNFTFVWAQFNGSVTIIQSATLTFGGAISATVD